MKIMYSARLGPETKCPNCQTRIISIGGTLYSCQNGHVLECVVMVTLNRVQQQVKTEINQAEQAPEPQRQIHSQSAIQTDEPILPPKKVQ